MYTRKSLLVFLALIILLSVSVGGVSAAYTNTDRQVVAQSGCSLSARAVGNMVNQFEIDYVLPEGTYTINFGDNVSAPFSGSGTAPKDYAYPPLDYTVFVEGIEGCTTAVHINVPEPPPPTEPEGQCSLSHTQGSAYNIFDFTFSGSTNQEWFHVSDNYGDDFDIPGNVGSTQFGRSYLDGVNASYTVVVSIAGNAICSDTVTVTVPTPDVPNPPPADNGGNPPPPAGGDTGSSYTGGWTCNNLQAYVDKTLMNRVHFYLPELPGGTTTTVYFGDGSSDAGVNAGNGGYTWHDYDLSQAPFTATVEGQNCSASLFVEGSSRPTANRPQSTGSSVNTQQQEATPVAPPSCLPDGSVIVVWQMWHRSFIVRIDAATDSESGQYTWLSHGLTRASNPQYSPNGCRLAFQSDDDIWVVNVEGEELHQVVEDAELATWHPNWMIEYTRDGAGYLTNQFGGETHSLE